MKNKESHRIVFKSRYLKLLLFLGMGQDKVKNQKKYLPKHIDFMKTPGMARELYDKEKPTWKEIDRIIINIEKILEENHIEQKNNIEMSKLSENQLEYNLDKVLDEQNNFIATLREITDNSKLGYQGFLQVTSITKDMSKEEQDQISNWYKTNEFKRMFKKKPLGVRKWMSRFSNTMDAGKKWDEYCELLLKMNSISQTVKSQQDKFKSCKSIYLKLKHKKHIECVAVNLNEHLKSIARSLKKMTLNSDQNNENDLIVCYGIACFLQHYYKEDWPGWNWSYNRTLADSNIFWEMLEGDDELKILFDANIYQ